MIRSLGRAAALVIRSLGRAAALVIRSLGRAAFLVSSTGGRPPCLSTREHQINPVSWPVPPPAPPPWYLRPFLWLAEKIAGQPLLPARVLSWYPKAAVGAGLLEAFVAHGADDGSGRELSTRLLKLVRLRVSFALHCPFCIEMNGAELDRAAVTAEEVRALQHGEAGLDRFSPAERAALVYAEHACRTPLAFPEAVTAAVAEHFTPRQIVILATTIAQVNYWGRMIQALGLPPIGAADACAVAEVGPAMDPVVRADRSGAPPA